MYKALGSSLALYKSAKRYMLGIQTGVVEAGGQKFMVTST